MCGPTCRGSRRDVLFSGIHHVRTTRARTLIALACLCCLGSLLGCPLYPPSWHAVFYDPNGATAGTPPTDFNRYPEGFAVTVSGNTGSLARTGYSFTGWNTEADGSGTHLGAGDTFTMGAVDATLYADWSWVPPAYHVVYDLNGGSGETPSDGNDYHTGDNATVLDASGLSRTGFSFIAWNTKSDGTGDAYDPGDVLAIGAADVRLYAVWLQDPPYHVTYDRNGGWSQPPVDPTGYQQGDTVTVLGNVLLERIGYAFGGWNTRADGSGDSYRGGDTFTMGVADVTLYAVWVTGFRVTYHENGGSGIVPDDPYGHLEGESVLVGYGDPALTRSENNFASWNTAPDGSGTNHAPGSHFPMPAADVDLWALWIPDDLSFNSGEDAVTVTGWTTGSGHLEIPTGVTSIGSSAFSGCTGLAGITLPSTLVFIGDGAFSGCTGLESILIPAGVTQISASTFSGCSSLASVTIPSTVASIGLQAFEYCSSLVNVTIPDSVSALGLSVFRECVNLVSVTLPALLTEIPYNTFGSCTSLTSVTIPATVTAIGAAAFAGCESLPSITIPSGVSSIGFRAFEACDNLLSVIVEAYDPPTLEEPPGSVFNPFPGERRIHVPTGTAAAYKSAAGWSLFADFITDE